MGEICDPDDLSASVTILVLITAKVLIQHRQCIEVAGATKGLTSSTTEGSESGWSSGFPWNRVSTGEMIELKTLLGLGACPALGLWAALLPTSCPADSSPARLLGVDWLSKEA